MRFEFLARTLDHQILLSPVILKIRIQQGCGCQLLPFPSWHDVVRYFSTHPLCPKNQDAIHTLRCLRLFFIKLLLCCCLVVDHQTAWVEKNIDIQVVVTKGNAHQCNPSSKRVQVRSIQCRLEYVADIHCPWNGCILWYTIIYYFGCIALSCCVHECGVFLFFWHCWQRNENGMELNQSSNLSSHQCQEI